MRYYLLRLPDDIYKAAREKAGAKDQSFNSYVTELVTTDCQIATRPKPTIYEQIRQTQTKFRQREGRLPTIIELQGETGLSYARIWNVVKQYDIKILSHEEYRKVLGHERASRTRVSA